MSQSDERKNYFSTISCVRANLVSVNNANLDKNNFDMFYHIDCSGAIHGRKWMNNVQNESTVNLA